MLNKILKAYSAHWPYYTISICGCIVAIIGLCIQSLILGIIGVVISLVISIVDKFHSDESTLKSQESLTLQ